MISTYLQLLEETVKKFEGVANLNRQHAANGHYTTFCLYAPIDPKTTIGCGIGAHLPLEKAKQLDRRFRPEIGIGNGIRCVVRDPEGKAIIEEAFDVRAIGLDNLVTFQGLHDGSYTVEEYLTKLYAAIEREKDPNKDAPPF